MGRRATGRSDIPTWHGEINITLWILRSLWKPCQVNKSIKFSHFIGRPTETAEPRRGGGNALPGDGVEITERENKRALYIRVAGLLTMEVTRSTRVPSVAYVRCYHQRWGNVSLCNLNFRVRVVNSSPRVLIHSRISRSLFYTGKAISTSVAHNSRALITG